MRYVMPVLLALVLCLLVPAHVAGETTETRKVVKTLTMRKSVPVKTLAALTGLVPASPAECVAAETRSGRAWLEANFNDNSRWEFSNVNYAGLAYSDLNLIVIDSDMSDRNGTPTCGYAMATVFHEWVHIQTAVYYGSMDKAMITLGCGEPMPEFTAPAGSPCRNIELIADCGGMWLSQMANVKEHHPYLDHYGCSNDQMLLAQRVINGY